MKKIIIFYCLSAILILIFASFSSIASAQATQLITRNKAISDILFQKTGITDDELEEKTSESQWFPGFLLVQIVKGIAALILILLILFDIIDPEEE